MSILKSQRGMTFVEVLVAIIIISILIPAISSSIYSIMKSYAWSKEYSDMCSIISTVDGTIQRELSLAVSASMDDDAIKYSKYGGLSQRMETKDDPFDDEEVSILHINDTPVFDTDLYENVNVTANFTIEPELIRVRVIYDGVVRHTSDFAISKLCTDENAAY